MLFDIIKISLLCIFIGAASIPVSFDVNDNPLIVWLGNASGSIISAAVVIYIGNRITNKKFKKKVSKRRLGKKVVKAFDEGGNNEEIKKASRFINTHGLRLFSLICPVFPGVLLSTVVVYALDLDKKIYKRWMLTGVFFISGAYVMGFWLIFVRN